MSALRFETTALRFETSGLLKMPRLVLYSNSLMGKYVLVRGFELATETPETMEYLYDHSLPMYDYIEKNNRKKIKIVCLNTGVHRVEWKGIAYKIEVALPHDKLTLTDHQSSILYQIDVSVCGCPAPNEAKELLLAFVDHCKSHVEEAMENYCKDAGKTIKKFIWDPAHDGSWTILNIANKRPMDSVFLPKEDKQLLHESVRTFVKEETQAEYARFNMPYKLNILLHGTPGTGKTSCIHAIASDIDSDIGIIHFGRGVDDTVLTKAINQMSNLEKCRVLVFEDIDSLFSDERKAHDSAKNSITLSGLLNCLDGLSRNEGLIVVLTTNRRDILEDVALTRSCRVDIELEFKDATSDQIGEMIQYYFPDQVKDKLGDPAIRARFDSVVETLLLKRATTAKLQQYFFEQRHCRDILKLPNFKSFWNGSNSKTTLKQPQLYM